MSKRKKCHKKIFRTSMFFLLIFSIIINLIYSELHPKIVNAATTQGSGIVRTADTSTVDSYKNMETYGLIGGRYNGRVWTDKSVYSHDDTQNVSLDDGKFNIEYDDDFLTVFSALGSSQIVKNTVAYDVSIMIDVSGSMGTDVVDNVSHPDEETRIKHSRIQLTIDAVNNAIDKLMESNDKNRVTVVAYGTTAYTLMELGHYTKISNKPYIKVEDFTTYNEKNYSASGSCAYTLRVNAIKDENETITRTVRNNYGKDISTDKKASLSSYIGFHTNMQAGIYQGFQELYENADTNIIRFPSALIMSDGASNYALKKSGEITGNEWYDVPIVNKVETYDDSNYLTFTEKYRAETNEMGKGGRETILDILMTASYMKAKVQKKYEKIFNASPYGELENSLNFQVHTVGVDTKNMLGAVNSKWQVPRIYSTLDPKKYFKENLDVDWDFKQDSIDAYTLYEQWKTNPGGATSSFIDTSNDTINFKINKLPTGNEVSNQDIIDNIIYNDSFEDVSASDIDTWFEDMMINVSSFNPFGDSENDAGDQGALSYVDPIGKYMEVKDVKSLLLFGKEYKIIKDGNPKVEDNDGQKVTKQYYRAVDSSNNDLTVTNPSYTKETKFKLSDIKIWKEISDSYITDEWTDVDRSFDEAMHISVPSAAIPIHLDTIELDASNKVKAYKSNLNDDGSLPIRVIYTVGISSSILNKNNMIDLTALSSQYFMNNKEETNTGGQKKTYINFYSNYYSGEMYDKNNNKTMGNATITFTPSLTNRFYVFQKNLVIYQNSFGGDVNGEGELESTGGKVRLTNPVTDITQIDKNKTYYFTIDYYIPGKQTDGSEGKLVKYAIAHKGEEFYGLNNECYLSYYDESQGTVVADKGPGIVVATKKGANRVGDLKYLSKEKENNETNTSDTYYAPSYGHSGENQNTYSIITYLGNNGRLRLQTTELLITKRVENQNKDYFLKAKNQDFDFTLTMDGNTATTKDVMKIIWNGAEWIPKTGKTYVETDNDGYIFYKDGSLSPYWVGNDKETERLVNSSGKMTVYKNSSKEEPQEIDIYTDERKTESNFQLDIEIETVKLNFTKTSDGISASFKLKDDEGILLSDLGANLNYTVKEDNTESLPKGFEFVSVNGNKDTPVYSATINAGRTENVEFLNKYTEATYTLQVSKTVVSTIAEKKRDWTFNITFIPTEDVLIFDSYDYEGLNIVDGVDPPGNGKINLTKNVDNSYTGKITLKHGQAIKIKGLGEGITYKITEDGANTDKYITTYTLNDAEDVKNYDNSQGVTGTITQNQKVNFRNAYPVVDFEFTKVASEDNENKLNGAEFALYEFICEDETHPDHDKIIDPDSTSSCWKLVGEAVSGKNSGSEETKEGLVKFEEIKVGVEYRLIEKKATFNRIKPVGQWQIKYTSTATKPSIVAVGEISKTPAFIEKNGNYLLPNMKLFQLPIAGGNIFINLIFFGIGLLLIYISTRNIVIIKNDKIKKEGL